MTLNQQIYIPKFPDFIKLDTKDFLKVIREVKPNIPRMDLTPTIAISFLNYKNQLEFTKIYSNLLLRYYDFDYGKICYSVYGINSLDQSLNSIFELQKSEGLQQIVTYLDQEQAANISNSNLFTTSPMDYANEYIIKTADHTTLSNPKLKDEAMHIRSFIRRYGEDVKVSEFELSKQSNIIELLHDWNGWDKLYVNKNNDPSNAERKQIELFLKNADILPTKCLVLKHLNKIVGFTFYDMYYEHSCAVGHFMKVNYSLSHIFDFMVHALCSRLNSDGIKYINIEGDLGVPGIRYKKLSLLPVKTLKFYTVEPNN